MKYYGNKNDNTIIGSDYVCVHQLNSIFSLIKKVMDFPNCCLWNKLFVSVMRFVSLSEN